MSVFCLLFSFRNKKDDAYFLLLINYYYYYYTQDKIRVIYQIFFLNIKN
jgi:hypothetical protein